MTSTAPKARSRSREVAGTRRSAVIQCLALCRQVVTTAHGHWQQTSLQKGFSADEDERFDSAADETLSHYG